MKEKPRLSKTELTWEPLDMIRAKPHAFESDRYVEAMAAFFVLLVAERQEADRVAVRAFDEGADALLAELDPLTPKNDWRDWKLYSAEEDGDLVTFVESRVLADIVRRYAARQHPLAVLSKVFDPKYIGPGALHSALTVAQSLTNPDEYNIAELREIFDVHYERWQTQADIRKVGEYVTPASLADFLADIVNIQPGDSLYCPAFGLGDLLVEIASKYDRRVDGQSTHHRLARPSFNGIERNQSCVLLTLARLLLSGVESPRLVVGNPLERSPGNTNENGGFDYVIALPPFGIRVDPKLSRGYKIPSSSGDNLFVQHVLDSLKPGGLGLIVVPRGLLFRDSDQKLREYLAKHVRLEAVIDLPVATFQPFTSIRTSVLAVSKKQPAQDVWFITESQYIEAVDANVGGDDDLDYKTLLVALSARLRRAESIREIEGEIERLESRITDQREMVEPEAAKWLANNNKTLLGLAHRFLTEGNSRRPETEVLNGTGLVPIDQIATRRWELILPSPSPQSLDALLSGLKETVPATKIVTLADIAHVSSGISYSRGAILDSNALTLGKSDRVGLIRVSDLPSVKSLKRDKVLSIFTSRTLTPEAAAQVREQAILKKHDVLLSTAGTVGKVGRFLDLDRDLLDQNTVASNGVAVIRLRNEFGSRALDAFLSRLFVSAPYQEWFATQSTGSTIRHLNLTRLRELPIPLLPPAEQLRVMDVIDVGVSADTILASLSVRPEYTEAIRWLADLPAMRAFSELQIRKAGHQAAEALSDLIKELNTALSSRRESSSEPFLDWVIAFRDFAQAVSRALALPPGTERFAALQGLRLDRRSRFPQLFQAYQAIRNSIVHQADSKFRFELPKRLLTRVQSLYDRVREICAVNEKNMLGNIQVTALVHPAVVAVGRPIELTVSLRNEAVLPLHDIHLLEPETSAPHCPLLPAGGSHNWAIPWTPREVGKQEFNVRWSGTRLDGASASGEAVVAVEVHSLRDSGLAQKSVRSPYVAGLSLSAKDKDKFFGRQDIIAEITRSLRTEGPGTVLILEGVRRVGKTSLLKQFLAPDALPGWIVAYCSLQRGKGHEKEHGLVTSEVFFRIARELLIAAHGAGCTVEVPRFRIVSPNEKVTKLKEDIRTVYGAVFSEDPNPFELLESVIESVLDGAADRRLFLMLDEFDKIQVGIETGVTSPQVPDNLRELFHSQPRVSAIFSGSQLMKRLRREYFSPLFGLAHRAIPIGPLDLKSAQLLVTQPAEGILVFSDIARDRIVELCACQPFLIQHICSQVFDICARENIESVTVDHVELAAKEWLEREQHFFEVWRDDVQDPRRQYLLCLIAELEKSGASVTFDLLRDTLEERLLSGDKALADHLDFLVDLTVVAREDRDGQKIYRIAVPLLSRWLALKVDASQYLARAVREDEGRL